MLPQLTIAINTVKAWKDAKSSMFLDSTPQKRTLEEPMREATWEIKGRRMDSYPVGLGAYRRKMAALFAIQSPYLAVLHKS